MAYTILLSSSHCYAIVFLFCSHQDPEQLFQACKLGDLEVVHRFLAAGVDVDIRDAVRLELAFLCVMSGVIVDTSFLNYYR